jgi:hypothetical protein
MRDIPMPVRTAKGEVGIDSLTSKDPVPETRTMAIPALPGAVETA